ncbi:MAG: glycosyltransferase family 87 protein [Calditrichia bacterium]
MQISARYVLILLVGISAFAGGYRYGAKGLWTDSSQWDLSSHVRAVHLLLSDNQEKPSLKPPFVPPYLPLAFPVLAGLGALSWDIARLLWLSMSLLMLGWLIHSTLRKLPSDLSVFLAVCVILSILLFKGSWLALAAGQMSLPVIFLLLWFFDNHRDKTWLPLIALGAATLKLTLAVPFFLFLLLRREIWQTVTAGFIALLLHFSSTFIFSAGPIGYWKQLWISVSSFESTGVNSYLLMGTSGRMDLAPLAAVFGVEGIGLLILLGAVAVVGLTLLYRYSNQLDDLTLLLLTNSLFFLLTYHRAYDLVLLVVLAIPVFWKHKVHLSPLFLLALLPFALPLQFILNTGLESSPQLCFIWHLIACSTPISMVCSSIWLLRENRLYFV